MSTAARSQRSISKPARPAGCTSSSARRTAIPSRPRSGASSRRPAPGFRRWSSRDSRSWQASRRRRRAGGRPAGRRSTTAWASFCSTAAPRQPSSRGKGGRVHRRDHPSGLGPDDDDGRPRARRDRPLPADPPEPARRHRSLSARSAGRQVRMAACSRRRKGLRDHRAVRRRKGDADPRAPSARAELELSVSATTRARARARWTAATTTSSTARSSTAAREAERVPGARDLQRQPVRDPALRGRAAAGGGPVGGARDRGAGRPPGAGGDAGVGAGVHRPAGPGRAARAARGPGHGRPRGDRRAARGPRSSSSRPRRSSSTWSSTTRSSARRRSWKGSCATSCGAAQPYTSAAR